MSARDRPRIRVGGPPYAWLTQLVASQGSPVSAPHETGEAAPSADLRCESWRPSAPARLPATEAGKPGLLGLLAAPPSP